jgi:hypothetical protein
VQFPQFKLDETYSLIAPLQALGVQTAFTPSADFSGISGVKPLFIGDAVQKSFINVDETGTEAAAATGLVGVTAGAVLIPPPSFSFNANHPFFFAIRDRATNTILFLGSVADPSNGATDHATPPTTTSSPAAPPETSNAPVTSPTSPITTPATPTQIVANVKVSNLSIHGVATRKFHGRVGVLKGIVSHAPKLGDLSGTIDWGDGTSSRAIFRRLGGKVVAVVASHIYAHAGSYAVTVDMTQTPYAKGKPVGDSMSMPAMHATAAIANRK